MKTNTLLTSALLLASLVPSAIADISATGATVPNMTPQMRGNCDLMASNTVRALFKGMRSLPVQTLEESEPSVIHVAEFEVIENLAHRRYVRYGDGAMPTGMRFTVSMDKDLPGQPADIADKIKQMNPGDEAVLKIDHLFLFGEPEGQNIHPCTRMALKPVEAQRPVEPAPISPLPQKGETSYTSSSVSVNVYPDGKGGYIEEKVQTSYDSATGKKQTRMYINGQEVDPQTRRPLAAPAVVAPPAAQPAGSGEDTIVETPPSAPNADNR